MTIQKWLSGLTCVAVVASGSLLIGAADAHAGERANSARVQGSRTGATVNRQTARQPGATTATRSVQGDLGRGATTVRDTTYGDGTAATNSTTTFNNGQTIQRQHSTTANGDGSVSTSGSRTTARGTATSTGSTALTEDGLARSKSVTTVDGKTASRAAVTSTDGNGTATQAVTLTAPSGEQKTINRSVSVSSTVPAESSEAK